MLQADDMFRYKYERVVSNVVSAMLCEEEREAKKSRAVERSSGSVKLVYRRLSAPRLVRRKDAERPHVMRGRNLSVPLFCATSMQESSPHITSESRPRVFTRLGRYLYEVHIRIRNRPRSFS
jgi:hypothetical protein